MFSNIDTIPDWPNESKMLWVNRVNQQTSHWEWLCKKSRSDKPARNKDNKSQQKSKKKPETSSSNSTKWNPSASTSSNNNKPAKPSASSTSISNKLGKDGKLSTEEHQRPFDNNLCLYCGGTGHKTADCKKAAASTSKAKSHVAAVIRVPGNNQEYM